MKDQENLKIFVVDDDPFYRNLVSQFLYNLGYEDVSLFEDGLSVLKELHHKPDVIFLDHNMEVLTGYEVLKKIKRFDPNIYTVMISAQEEVKIAVNILKHGAFDYIKKGDKEEDRIKEVIDKILWVKEALKQSQPNKLYKIIKTILISLVALVLFASCQTHNLLMEPKSEQKVVKNAPLDSTFFFDAAYEYQIRTDDKINISVWGQDEYSVGSIYGIYNSNEVYGKWLLVDAQGNIEVPKVGTINTLGKTVIELKNELKNLFAEWLVNPIVDVKVLNKEITILGEVRNPQVIQVDKDRNTLLEMIAQCQGFEFYADLKYVKVLRQKGEDVHIANLDLTEAGDYLSKNIQLYPGDVVIIPSRKCKNFDKRISTIIPFTTTATAAAILFTTFR